MSTAHKKDPFLERESKNYENPIPSREYIMQYLKEKGRPASKENLIRALALESDDQKEALRRRLIAMVRDGQIISNRRGSFALVDELELIKGKIEGHKDGFGFVIPEDGSEDIFLTPTQMRAVFPGDTVLTRVSRVDKRGRREGFIAEVIEHNTRQIVGRYFVEKGLAFVAPSNKEITQDIIIPPEYAGEAKHGQVVMVDVIAQPTPRRQPFGKIIEILGEHMAPGLEIDVAIRAHQLPYQWSEEVLKEIAQFQPEVAEADKKGRKDLRHLPFVTIDGEDARDFDDAVYAEKRKEGGWRLFVAIADVSYYVKPQTYLDKEALKRGNSVYFPERVIPMLPEILSNELCSLRPQVDRLAMVCEINISSNGKITRSAFYEAIIRSQARLTYAVVAAALQYKKSTAIPANLLSHLQQLYQLYHILIKQRAMRGALEFDTQETRIVFGEDRKIKEIIPVVRNDAHRLIEECMLLANVAAAKYLQQQKMATLFRVHGGPNQEKLENLRDFLKGMGLKLGGGDDPTPQDYAKLLQKIKGRTDERLIQTVLLRSLSQAVYAPINEGHFGLAFEAYAHFTSPIRRYPDLLVHRAIRHALQKSKQEFPYNPATMLKMGEHCSTTERRADEATRDAVAWLKCEYMQDKVGETFPGIITGVTGFGIFVELKNVFVEGLVHITALKNDYYHFDPIRHLLKGRQTGNVYRLGDPIEVLVARVNVDERQLDFELTQDQQPSFDTKKKAAKKAKKKRK